MSPENDFPDGSVPVWLGAQTWKAVFDIFVQDVFVHVKQKSSLSQLNFVGLMRIVAKSVSRDVQNRVQAAFIVFFPFFRSLELAVAGITHRKIIFAFQAVSFSKLYLQNLQHGWLHSQVSWNSFLSCIPSNMQVPAAFFQILGSNYKNLPVENVPPQLQSHASRSSPDVAGHTMSPASAPENAQS
jgi:hypothetical protein